MRRRERQSADSRTADIQSRRLVVYSFFFFESIPFILHIHTYYFSFLVFCSIYVFCWIWNLYFPSSMCCNCRGQDTPLKEIWSISISRHLASVSATIGWIDMKFCSDIHVLQRMNQSDFGDPLTFPLRPPWGWHFWSSSKMDWHEIWFIHVPQRTNLNNFWWFSPRKTFPSASAVLCAKC